LSADEKAGRWRGKVLLFSLLTNVLQTKKERRFGYSKPKTPE
jgi:hypothetical protein